MRPLKIAITLSMLLAAACGDDRAPAQDGMTGADLGADLAPAADGQAAPDRVPDQAPLPDVSTAAPDAGGPASLSGSVTLDPALTCGSVAATDCKGLLYVGVVDKPVAPPASTLLGAQTLAGVDLAAGPVSFSIDGLAGGTTVYLSAMLVESGPLPEPPFPAAGDLVVEPAPVTLAPGANSASLVLDSRWR